MAYERVSTSQSPSAFLWPQCPSIGPPKATLASMLPTPCLSGLPNGLALLHRDLQLRKGPSTCNESRQSPYHSQGSLLDGDSCSGSKQSSALRLYSMASTQPPVCHWGRETLLWTPSIQISRIFTFGITAIRVV